MNILLLEEKVSFFELCVNKKEAYHILKVLKVKVGDDIDVGLKNGPRGKALLLEITNGFLKFSINWQNFIDVDSYPVSLLVGLSRPQTCRKILEQATSMGVEQFHFFLGQKSEKSYIDSRLWKNKEWLRKIQNGAEQAFSTFIPSCVVWNDLRSCINGQETNSSLIALDNYESKKSLLTVKKSEFNHFTLAIGPERGWSTSERDILRNQGFNFFSLGTRVLRQETAVVTALSHIVCKYW